MSADLTQASERLLRDFDNAPDAINYSELSARLWLIEREARRAALASETTDAGLPLNDRERFDAMAAEAAAAMQKDFAENYVQLRAVVEFADRHAVVQADEDGLGEFYTHRAADWNRVIAVARGAVSEAARKVIERVITGDLSRANGDAAFASETTDAGLDVRDAEHRGCIAQAESLARGWREAAGRESELRAALSSSGFIDAERLARALPHAVNFRFLPPRNVNDPAWREMADDILARLSESVE